MTKRGFLLIFILFGFMPGVIQAKSPIWSVDCETLNSKISNWFILDEREGSTLPVFIGNDITVVPYPGLHDVKDVHNDHRIRWLSEDKISVSNSDKDAGWEGRLIFHRCHDAR